MNLRKLYEKVNGRDTKIALKSMVALYEIEEQIFFYVKPPPFLKLSEA